MWLDENFNHSILCVAILPVVGAVGTILLWNGIIWWLLLALALPLIAWIWKGGNTTTLNEIIDRLKKFKEFQTRIIFTVILFVPIVMALISYITILVNRREARNVAEIQKKWAVEQSLEKEKTPQVEIKMISDLSWIVKWTGIVLEYDVYNADTVYFKDLFGEYSVQLPLSGTNHFSQFVALDIPTTTVYIKGQNKFWSSEKEFTIEREKTTEELQQEKKEAEFNAQLNKEFEEIDKRDEIYDNSPKKLLKDKINNLTLWEKSNLTYECKEWVKSMLPSPSSADFPWVSLKFRLQWEQMVTDSFVDAQNYFWAQIRYEYECIWELNWENFLLVDVKI